MGQNRIRGGGGVKNRRKSSDIIYVRSLRVEMPLAETSNDRVKGLNLGGVNSQDRQFCQH
jgi:hypothetical protein